jgi:hypothetical protein
MHVRRFTFAMLALLSVSIGAWAQAPLVRAADLSKLSPADFRDDELDLPYYLAHFHRVANSVALSGPRRGFIDIAVWRNLEDNKPHNARIMESILSLAYFYTTDRPWNPYRGDPALRARLEAALEFFVGSQNADGRFSEYAPQRWSLAPTAFATKFMGETLRLLHEEGAPPIDSAIHRRAVEADRKAIMAVFTLPDQAEHGRFYTNQFSNAFGGALAYLALHPDAEMERALRAQLRVADTDHQSVVGYFYEANGPDWGYDLNTHHSNFHMAWNYLRGTTLQNELIGPMSRWYEWFAYNAVQEPQGRALTMNRSIESRQRQAIVSDAGPGEAETGNPLAEVVPGARVLGPTTEDLAQRRTQRRAELQRQWPTVAPLQVGSFRAFSPYTFLHRQHVRWYPSEQQWKAARDAMRPQAEQRFTHQRTDTRKPIVFSYVRRPWYYAAFTSGEVVTAQQRYGLGLFWSPVAGSVIQSQTAGTSTAWGTRRLDTTLVYEAASFAATTRAGGKQVMDAPGNRDLPPGDLRVEYPLGSRGRKTVAFDDGGVHVSVVHEGAFVEQLPFILFATDSLSSTPGLLELRRGNALVVLRWAPATTAIVERTEERSGERRVVAVGIPATGKLTYDLQAR